LSISGVAKTIEVVKLTFAASNESCNLLLSVERWCVCAVNGVQLEKDTRSDTELEDTDTEDEHVVDRTKVCNNNADSRPPANSQVKKTQ